jgi:hypothetical protein
MHCKLFLKLGVRTPSPSGPSGTSLKQDTSFHAQYPTSGQLPKGFQMLLSFKSQSIRQLPNGFQILLSQKFQCTRKLLTQFQQLFYFKSQSIGQLTNGFQISCSFRSQSIGQLPSGLERIQNSQSQSIGQLPNGLLDASYTKHLIREALLTNVVCTNVQLRIS